MAVKLSIIIDRLIYDKRITMGDLAKKVGVHPASLGKVINNPDMKPSKIKKFSEVFETDLFVHFSNNLKLPKPPTEKNPETTECEKLLEESKTEIAQLQKEIAYLKQINELLGKK